MLGGVWIFCDSWNVLHGRPAGPRTRLHLAGVWAAAGLLFAAACAAIGTLTGQGRAPVGFESPAFHEHALLAPLGPALRAAYLRLADSLGLPSWPPRENWPALIR